MKLKDQQIVCSQFAGLTTVLRRFSGSMTPQMWMMYDHFSASIYEERVLIRAEAIDYLGQLLVFLQETKLPDVVTGIGALTLHSIAKSFKLPPLQSLKVTDVDDNAVIFFDVICIVCSLKPLMTEDNFYILSDLSKKLTTLLVAKHYESTSALKNVLIQLKNITSTPVNSNDRIASKRIEMYFTTVNEQIDILHELLGFNDNVISLT